VRTVDNCRSSTTYRRRSKHDQRCGPTRSPASAFRGETTKPFPRADTPMAWARCAGAGSSPTVRPPPYGPKTDPQCCGCLARSICHLAERHCGVALQVVVRRVIFQTPLAEDPMRNLLSQLRCILQQSFIELKGQLDRHWDLT